MIIVLPIVSRFAFSAIISVRAYLFRKKTRDRYYLNIKMMTEQPETWQATQVLMLPPVPRVYPGRQERQLAPAAEQESQFAPQAEQDPELR